MKVPMPMVQVSLILFNFEVLDEARFYLKSDIENLFSKTRGYNDMCEKDRPRKSRSVYKVDIVDDGSSSDGVGSSDYSYDDMEVFGAAPNTLGSSPPLV